MNSPKRKVTDLLQNEAILISNDFERDVILKLMEDAGKDWADGEKATNWNPIQVGYEYPFVLFNHPHDIGCIAFRAFGDQINILPILNATDFINTEAEW